MGITGIFFFFGKNTEQKSENIEKNRKIQRKYREKTGNIFSKIEQMLTFLEWMLSEKKAASECTKNCTINLIFHVYFMVFDILEGIQQVGTKRRHLKKKQKIEKIAQNLYLSFLGFSKNLCSAHTKKSHLSQN